METTLLVAWKDSTTYGVDAISYSAKYASAYLTTLNVGGSPEKSKAFENYVVSYKQRPASTAVALSYDPDYAGSFTSITLTEKTAYNKYIAKKNLEARTAKFKMTFTINGNDAPEVESFYVDWNEKEVL